MKSGLAQEPARVPLEYVEKIVDPQWRRLDVCLGACPDCGREVWAHFKVRFGCDDKSESGGHLWQSISNHDTGPHTYHQEAQDTKAMLGPPEPIPYTYSLT